MTNLTKKKGIIRVPFSRLLKLELPELAERVMRIVDKHDPKVLKIEEVFELLVDEQPQIDNLNARYGVHPLSIKLKPMREKLLLKVSRLKLDLNVASKSTTDLTKDAVIDLQLAIDRHLLKLRSSKNEAIMNRKIAQFLHEHSTSEKLQTAIEVLGFTAVIDSLQSAHTVVRELLDDRLALTSLRPKESSNEIADYVETALINLFKQIEVAQLKNKLVDYKPLIDELNDTLNVFRNLINIREANNKRKAEEKKALEAGGTVDEDDDSTEEPGVMGASRMFVAPANGNFAPEAEGHSSNGSGEDLDQSLDQKKTVASSGKLTQLPSVKNEDENSNSLN